MRQLSKIPPALLTAVNVETTSDAQVGVAGVLNGGGREKKEARTRFISTVKAAITNASLLYHVDVAGILVGRSGKHNLVRTRTKWEHLDRTLELRAASKLSL